MKDFYSMLLMISIICLGGDSESFLMFVIWHIVWLAVMLFSWYQLDRLEGEEE